MINPEYSTKVLVEQITENRIEMLSSWVDDYFKKYKIYYRTKPVNDIFPAGYAKTFKITKIERRKRK
jgi:hypothetical protein